MASIINASTAGVGGVITTADNSGVLNIQSGGTTIAAVTSTGVAVTGTVSASSTISSSAVNGFLTNNGVSTSGKYISIANTGGTAQIGVESSAGGTQIVGSSAYMTAIVGQAGIGFSGNNGTTLHATLNASGNLLVGTTTAPAANGGGIAIYRSDYARLSFRNSTTGDAVGDGTQVYAGGVDFVVNNAEATGRIYMTSNTNGVYLAANATSWTANSDERLKTDLIPIENAAEKVSTLRAVTGRFKTDDEGTSRSFLIAQDVQAVLPEAVNVQDDEQGTLGVQYTDVIPLLVAAIKELKAEIDLLKGAK